MRGGPRETLIPIRRSRAPHRILHRLGSEHLAGATDGARDETLGNSAKFYINPERLPVVSIVGQKQYRTNRGLERPSVLGSLQDPRKA
jgi:hypothetical protein